MKLRVATIEEFEAVRDFYWNLIDAVKDRSDTVGWKKGIYPTDDFIRESLQSGELYVIDDEEGYCASVIVNSRYNEGYVGIPWSVSCQDSEVLIPHALAVKVSVQQQGIGKTVVSDIIQLARDKGMRTIRLDLLSGNIAAERLYTSQGFQMVQAKEMFYEDTGWTEFIMYEMVL